MGGCRGGRRGDVDVHALADESLSRSHEFQQLGDRHEVGIQPDDRKTSTHPRVGRISVDCEILATADGNQRLVILSAPPASESHGKLKRSAFSAGRGRLSFA